MSTDSNDKDQKTEFTDVYKEYKKKVDRIAPWLLETRWLPMSYMLIPSVVRDADLLIASIEAADAGPDQKNLEALLEKLRYLRSTFCMIVREPKIEGKPK